MRKTKPRRKRQSKRSYFYRKRYFFADLDPYN